MVSTVARSPALLGGYLQLGRAMKRANSTRRISERSSIAIQVRHGCELCLDSHIAAATALGLDEDEIEHARRGGPETPRSPRSCRSLSGCTASRPPSAMRMWRAASTRLQDREIANVVGVVALYVLTGAFKPVAGLEPAPSP